MSACSVLGPVDHSAVLSVTLLLWPWLLIPLWAIFLLLRPLLGACFYPNQAMLSRPVLQMPDLQRSFLVHTDASGFAVATLLEQVLTGPMALNLSPTYPPGDQEGLAIVLALDAWPCYVTGLHFVVDVDHETLQQLYSHATFSSYISGTFCSGFSGLCLPYISVMFRVQPMMLSAAALICLS